MRARRWSYQKQWRQPRELKVKSLTNTYAEHFSCVGTEKTLSTTPTVCSTPMQSLSRAKLWPWHHVNPWNWCFRLHTTYFSVPNLTFSSLHLEQKGKAGLLSENRAAVLTVVTQRLHGRCVILCIFCAYTISVHFSGESIHRFITNSNGSLTWTRLKAQCIWTEAIGNVGKTAALGGFNRYTGFIVKALVAQGWEIWAF